MKLWPERPEDVACPRCKAAVGQPCRHPNGRMVPEGYHHTDRKTVMEAERKLVMRQ